MWFVHLFVLLLYSTDPRCTQPERLFAYLVVRLRQKRGEMKRLLLILGVLVTLLDTSEVPY
jgi:hypothetical protein